jgi:hypothetical protein
MKKIIILSFLMSFLYAEQFSKSLTTIGWHNLGVPTDVNITNNTFGEDISLVWQWNSVTQSWQFYSKDTTLLSAVDKLNISIITTLETGDAIWVKNRAVTSIHFTDFCTEPNLSSLLTSPKVYNYTDLDASIIVTISQYDSNKIKLLSTQILSDSNFNPLLNDTTEYIFTWTGKGYESNYSIYNDTVYQGKYNSTYDFTMKIDKGKEFIDLDCFNKEIKTKNYYLYTMTISKDSENNTRYFVQTNLDDSIEVSAYDYHTFLSEFDTKYESLAVVVDTDTPADIASQIFKDLGF